MFLGKGALKAVNLELSQGCKTFTQMIFEFIALQKPRQHLSFRGWRDLNDPKSKRMVHLKMQGVALFHDRPKAPNPKATFFHAGVMEQDDCPRGELGQPGLKIMLNRLIGVKAIYVQEVYALVLDVVQGRIKGFLRRVENPE